MQHQEDLIHLEDTPPEEHSRGQTRSGLSYQSERAQQRSGTLLPGHKRSGQGQDLEGLINDLPNIHNGASKCIREFEEKTQEKKLAIGDIKAILARMIGQDETTRVIRAASYHLWNAGTSDSDAIEFDPYRNFIWTELRDEYPTHLDLGQLQGETISLSA